MKRLIVILGIVVMFMFSVSVSNVLAQDICEGDLNCDENVDAMDVTTFLEDFGRNQFNLPCPNADLGVWRSHNERLFCQSSSDCHDRDYVTTGDGQQVCCCWSMFGQYNFGCRGVNYCRNALWGDCL